MNIAVQNPPAVTATAAEIDELSLFAHRRSTIDMIASLRARAVRAALFGTYMLRDNPVTPESEDTRAQWTQVLREQSDSIARTLSILHGKDPDGVVPAQICKWIAEAAQKRPAAIEDITKMKMLTENIVKAVDGDAEALDAALQVHFKFGNEIFFKSVTDFCDSLWSELDVARYEEVQGAHEAARAIDGTLSRLERIGKHVRLVSLNASVEAARVGEEGKGLGVIAVEFKALAEEIQRLAVTAREDIAAFSVATH